jgi:hypothetical protein
VGAEASRAAASGWQRVDCSGPSGDPGTPATATPARSPKPTENHERLSAAPPPFPTREPAKVGATLDQLRVEGVDGAMISATNTIKLPDVRGEVSCFGELKRWQPEDMRERSLARDLWATGKLCELLGLCSADEAAAFEDAFHELADLGYAGYCYYDFASVSRQGMLDVFEALMREHLGAPEFEALHIWDFDGHYLNARELDSHGSVRMIFKNGQEASGSDVVFCRYMRFDDKWGVEAGESTAKRSVELYRAEFGAAHSAYAPIAIPFKDLFTLITMDVLNAMHPQPGDEAFARRIPLIRALKDVDAGRWLEGDRTGHIFVNSDTSLGMEATAGFEALKSGICLGAELPAAVEP